MNSYQPHSPDPRPLAHVRLRFNVAGRRLTFACWLPPERATAVAAELRQRARDGATKAELETWLETATAVPAATVFAGIDTVGALVRAHAAAQHAGCFDASEAVLHLYRQGLLNVVDVVVCGRAGLARGLRHRGARLIGLDDYPASVTEFPLALIDEFFVQNYATFRLAGLTPGTAAYEGTCNTVRTVIERLRSMFSHAAQAAYARAGLALSNPNAALTWPTFPRVPHCCLPPTFDRLQAAHRALGDAHASGDEDVFLIIALALHAGLTRTEIMHATRDWLVAPSSLLVMPGCRTARQVPLPAWLHARVSARPAGRLLPRSHTQVHARAVRFLRARGAAEPRPLLACRDFYAGYLLSQFPSTVAQTLLGLGPKGMARFALGKYTRMALALWLRALPSAALPPKAPVTLKRLATRRRPRS